MAVSSGASSLEAAALVSDADAADPADLAVVREAGRSAVVFHAGANGVLRATVQPLTSLTPSQRGTHASN